MAYSVSNAPFLMTAPAIGGGYRAGSSDAINGIWMYASTHATSDVRAAGFVTNALEIGAKVGAPIFVWDSGNSDLTLNVWSAVSSTGGTISSAST